jgi:hypothetical protein
MEKETQKLAYASWVICSLVFFYTGLRLTVLFIATARRRHWHLQLHQIRIRRRATDTGALILSAPFAALSLSIPLRSLADSDKTDGSAAFIRPEVGWKSAYLATQEERTGLRELFL